MNIRKDIVCFSSFNFVLAALLICPYNNNSKKFIINRCILIVDLHIYKIVLFNNISYSCMTLLDLFFFFSIGALKWFFKKNKLTWYRLIMILPAIFFVLSLYFAIEVTYNSTAMSYLSQCFCSWLFNDLYLTIQTFVYKHTQWILFLNLLKMYRRLIMLLCYWSIQKYIFVVEI